MSRARTPLAPWVLAAAALLAAGLAGCSSLTQLVVIVDTDLTVPDELDRVVLEIDRESNGVATGMGRTAALDLAREQRPGSISLVHEGGPTTVLITARGFHGDTEVVVKSLRTSFVEGQSRAVRLTLTRACVGDPACAEPELVSTEPWRGSPPAALPPTTPPDGGLDLGMPDGGGPDADTGPPPPDAGDPDAGCDLLHPPAMPTVADGPSIEEIWFAVDHAELVTNPRVGYDLDDRCSLPEVGDPPPLDCAPTSPVIIPFDGERGVDNSLNGFLTFIDGAVEGLFSAPLNESITASFRAGQIGLLFRLSDWNGTPDDPDVSCAIAEAAFGAPSGGSINWYGSSSSFDRTVDNPLNTEVRAYVTGGVLVARMRDGAELTLNNGAQALRFDLNRMIITANLSRSGPGDGVLENGVISARWPREKALAGLTGLGLPPTGRCVDERSLAEMAIVNSLDVRSDPAEIAETETCDAISVGIGFGAVEARVVGIQDPDPLSDLCILP